jgi:uncharacterized membrane protein
VKALITGVAVLAPLMLHWAIVSESEFLLRAFFLIVAAAFVVAGVQGGRIVRHGLAALALVAIAYLVDIRFTRAFAPVWAAFVYVGLAWLFARTLRGDAVPLIERFARMEHTEGMTPELVRYARLVTQVWSIYFIVLAMAIMVLTIVASTETLSLFTNVLSWFFLAGLYFAEYAYRQWWAFPHVPHKNPVRIALLIMRNAPQLLR